MLQRPISVANQAAINLVFICLEHGNEEWTFIGYLCIVVGVLLVLC